MQRHFKPIQWAGPGLPETLRRHHRYHTAATLLAASGIHPKIAAERLGHASTRMTRQVSSHLLPGMQEEATRKLEELIFR